MADLKPIASTAHISLDLPPSCAQFCPTDAAFFVVGTYNLETESAPTTSTAMDGLPREQEAGSNSPQSRNGTLLLFKIDGSSL